MGKRIVIALGGNALGNNLPEQMIAVKKTASAIVDLIEAGNEVVIAHGNGPQVGMIQNAMSELTRSNPEKYIPCPLSVCVAMSQGYIGYDLQNALREEMLDRGINTGCTTILTQVEVDANDPAFENPTKPIGAFMTKEEADKLVKEKGYKVVEDAGRGYRRVVASPKPKSIIEIDTIRSLVDMREKSGAAVVVLTIATMYPYLRHRIPEIQAENLTLESARKNAQHATVKSQSAVGESRDSIGSQAADSMTDSPADSRDSQAGEVQDPAADK